MSQQDDQFVAFADRNDAKGINLQNLLEDERALFYDWGQVHFNFSRGRALIFHDDLNLSHPLQLAKCFKNLDYNVKVGAVKNIPNDIGTSFKQII
jgi:hypothetical protein